MALYYGENHFIISIPSISLHIQHSTCDLQCPIQILRWLVVPDMDSCVTCSKTTFYKLCAAARLHH